MEREQWSVKLKEMLYKKREIEVEIRNKRNDLSQINDEIEDFVKTCPTEHTSHGTCPTCRRIVHSSQYR